MIIQSLYERYVQLSADPDSGVCPPNYSVGKVSFVLELSPEGELTNVLDLREMNGKKLVPRQMIVPEQGSRSSGIKPYFLSDKAEYMLGHYPLTGKPGEENKKMNDARRKFAASRELHWRILGSSEDETAKAIVAFFAAWNPEKVRQHPRLRDVLDDLDKGIDTNVVFRIAGQQGFAHQQRAIRAIWEKNCEQEQPYSDTGQCLVTGTPDESIAKTHDIKIKGVRGSQAAGAALVSFNAPAFLSYDKEQSFNAPVSKTAAFGYATALNHLLGSERNCIRNFGDMTVVFWSGPSPASRELETFFADFIAQEEIAAAAPAEDASLTAHLKDVMKRARAGAKLTADMLPETSTPFYILGLSPNNARLAVRFFWQGDFSTLLNKLVQHASDFAITGKKSSEPDHPTLTRIVRETMRAGSDGKKVGEEPPASLKGDMFRAVIQGTAYPYSLFVSIINRIRADGIVSRLRAAIVKACLARYGRFHKTGLYKEETLTVSLNKETKNPGYRLGRLFAVLERAQQDAAGGPNRINATIKDRFFSSASSTPLAVFPNLLRLSQSHMSKANNTGKYKLGNIRDKEISEIMEGLDGFPARLNLQEQGMFILGYYHQKEDFFSRSNADDAAPSESRPE